MRRLSIILVFAGLFFLLPEFSYAQKRTKKEDFKEDHTPFGRRKKERKNQKGTSNSIAKRGGIFKRRGRSAGNADAFAKNSAGGSKGFIHKMFHPNGTKTRNASLRKTKPGRVQNREQKGLFNRLFTKNKGRHEQIQSRQRKTRSRTRTRGNAVFAKKKS